MKAIRDARVTQPSAAHRKCINALLIFFFSSFSCLLYQMEYHAHIRQPCIDVISCACQLCYILAKIMKLSQRVKNNPSFMS